jgi:heavy metal sensor kinase
MNTRSLRFQLVAWYTTLLVVAFALVSLFMYLALNRVLMENLKEILSRRVRKMAHLISDDKPPITTEVIREEMVTLFAPETPEGVGRFFRVSRPDGSIIYQAGRPLDGSFDPHKVAIFKPDEEREFRTEKAGDAALLIRMEKAKTADGLIVIEAGGALAPIHTTVGHMVQALGVAAPPFIFFAAVGAYVLIGRALRPVAQITQSAEEISLQNLGESVPVAQTGDELETLSLALNRMIKRLHDSVENTRRFVADASHELRTPLAVLRGEMENVISQNRLSPEARDRVASNLEEVERLSKIVQGLSALSRLDCGEAQAETVQFDLAKVAATTTEQMCLLAEDKGIHLVCDSLAGAPMRGDPARIKQIVVNLVDNAINYTLEGGRIEVRTFCKDGRSVLEVRDTGIGIPQDAQAKVFERFFRVDKARSRDVGGGGGLGLSIVKSICAAHGGQIKLESELGKGSCFRIEFPAAPVEPPPQKSLTSTLKRTAQVAVPH